MKEEGSVDKSCYTTNIVGLLSFYIPKLQSLTSRSDLELLVYYRILPTLNPTFYYSNYFIYALEQYGVPSDKIDVIRTYLISIYVKIKDIRYLGKLLKLWFIIFLSRDHIKEWYRLIKLGKPENKQIIGYKSCQKPIPLLIYEDHLMLYNVNITFNGCSYMNTWHLIGILINDNTIVRVVINEKQTLMNAIDKKLVKISESSFSRSNLWIIQSTTLISNSNCAFLRFDLLLSAWKLV